MDMISGVPIICDVRSVEKIKFISSKIENNKLIIDIDGRTIVGDLWIVPDNCYNNKHDISEAANRHQVNYGDEGREEGSSDSRDIG